MCSSPQAGHKRIATRFSAVISVPGGALKPVGTATAVTGQVVKIFLSIMSDLQIFETFLIQDVPYQAAHYDRKNLAVDVNATVTRGRRCSLRLRRNRRQPSRTYLNTRWARKFIWANYEHVVVCASRKKLVDRNFPFAYKIDLHCGLMPLTLAQLAAQLLFIAVRTGV
jgi:hypothetical protein